MGYYKECAELDRCRDHSSWNQRSISGGSRLDDKTKIMFLAFELGLRIMPD